MAKHRRRERDCRPRAQRWVHAANAVAAVGLTTAITLALAPTPPAHIDVQPAGVTVGVGPLGDGFGILPPIFFQGSTVPAGDNYLPVSYSALLFGFDLPLGQLPYFPVALDRSIAGGQQDLGATLAGIPAGEATRVVGMSLGAIVVDKTRVELTRTATSPNYSFLLIGDPLTPDGGFLTRFGNFTIPILNYTFGRGAVDGDFPTTDVNFEYDFFSDFPKYFNPLAIANSVAGLVFTHILPGYVFADPNAPGAVATTVGNTTYVRMATDLPLLFPLRMVTSFFGMQRITDALDAVLRPLVDMAYDRNDDPSVVTTFQMATPQANIDAALAKMPGAIAQAIAILQGAPYTPVNELPSPDSAISADTTVTTAAAAIAANDAKAAAETAAAQAAAGIPPPAVTSAELPRSAFGDAVLTAATTLADDYKIGAATLTNDIQTAQTTLANDVKSAQTTLANDLKSAQTTLTDDLKSAQTTLANDLKSAGTTLAGGAKTTSATATSASSSPALQTVNVQQVQGKSDTAQKTQTSVDRAGTHSHPAGDSQSQASDGTTSTGRHRVSGDDSSAAQTATGNGRHAAAGSQAAGAGSGASARQSKDAGSGGATGQAPRHAAPDTPKKSTSQTDSGNRN